MSCILDFSTASCFCIDIDCQVMQWKESGSFRSYSRSVRSFRLGSFRPEFRGESFRPNWGGSFRPNFKGGSFRPDFRGESFRPDFYIWGKTFKILG